MSRIQNIQQLNDLIQDIDTLELPQLDEAQENKTKAFSSNVAYVLAKKHLVNRAIFKESANDRQKQFHDFMESLTRIEDNLAERRENLELSKQMPATQENLHVQKLELLLYKQDVLNYANLLQTAHSDDSLISRIQKKNDKKDGQPFIQECNANFAQKIGALSQNHLATLTSFTQFNNKLSPNGFISSLLQEYSNDYNNIRWGITKWSGNIRQQQTQFLQQLVSTNASPQAIVGGMLLIKHQIERDSPNGGNPRLFFRGSQLKRLINDYLTNNAKQAHSELTESNYLEALQNTGFLDNQKLPENFKQDFYEVKDKYLMAENASAAQSLLS